MVRAIDQLDARQLAGIVAPTAPFFSPDSLWIGFFENDTIKKVSIAGGPVVTLGPVTGAARGATWGDDNTIVFATDDPGTGLWRVSAEGGEPTVLTRPDADAAGETITSSRRCCQMAGACCSRLPQRPGRQRNEWRCST